MKFEFDPIKSAVNKAKHGIDFVEAQALWRGNVMQFDLPFEIEPRYMIIGEIEQKVWTACVTYRNDAIRIISVRRAREKEQDRYESLRRNH